MIQATGFAAKNAHSPLARMAFERPDAGPNDVEIQVLFCGVCHSDIHQVKNEWSNTVYPYMPGHEVVGRIKRVGAQVSRHKAGDLVGVGCMIDSCRQCQPCQHGEQNYCQGPNSWLAIYNGPMVLAAKAPNGKNSYGRENTFGGYSDVMVVDQDFVLKIPAALKPEVAAPVLCAGVTTWSPMKHWKVKAGQQVGVIGFGGLGDMAVKLAVALGAHVTVFTRESGKLKDAKRLGAEGVLETDQQAMSAVALKAKFDFMLSTVPEKRDVNP